MENLGKAKMNWRRPLPWRSADESETIRRFVAWWFTARGERPSARAWARGLGISHTWMQKLIREFQANPTSVRELLAGRRDPTFAELEDARELTKEMRMPGEIRRFRRRRLG